MVAISIRPYITPLIHILVWALLGFLLLLYPPLSWQNSLQITLPREFWIKQAVELILLISIFYINATIWVPKFLFNNRNGLFIGLIIVTSVGTVYIIETVETWFNLDLLMHRAFHPNDDSEPRPKFTFDVFMFVFTLLVLGISTAITAVQTWQKDAQLRQQLEQQKVSSELSFLKAQINPHFFFNTLNNIYALTTLNVELARQALHKLSRMMRYVLYETKKDTTLLSQEISFLQDYIELMQLRLTDKVEVTFEKPTLLKDVLIAPMLLLPFIENAFKHGVSAQFSSCIHIALHQQNSMLQLQVVNNIFTNVGPSLEESSGIGLVNTKRRLDLLYPGHYMLNVNEKSENNEYQVNLTLNLS